MRCMACGGCCRLWGRVGFRVLAVARVRGGGLGCLKLNPTKP